ncbi:MAG: PIN domain-containing protein [Immundisolibacter sp.]|uniref:PIN domain-containing protein n=1 Tax=Immundisolibacter sp. TaxID=1934948 RepID=UPI0019C4638D|nr:PIN domain-containing protein [Immundisolibacter sp.]MBC7161758.1 PIN domain-containing protein [Immundisolibacter sp.]
MTRLLDSVIVIDHLNGIEPATRYLSAHGADCAVSVITRAEVLAGFDDTHTALARELLDLFPTLPITLDIADLAARLRRSERWKLPDAFQAALAMHHGLALVTRNTRDFRSGAGLEVVVPYGV